jgi:molecular chaperone DnaK
MKLGEAVYKSQQKPEAKKTDGTKDSKPDDKENVVDADFEDVKDKEEDKEKSA